MDDLDNFRNLKELARIRAEIVRLQDLAKFIEPDAVLEGLQALTEPDKKGQVVFSDDNAKIVLQYRKRCDPTTEIDRITEDIDREIVRLSQETLEERQDIAEYIAELEQSIAQAKTISDNLISSPRLGQLRTQLSIARKKAEFQIATLAVHVKEKRN